MRTRVAVVLLVLAGVVAGGFQVVTQLPPTEIIEVSCCWADVPFEQLMNTAELIAIGRVAGLGRPEWSPQIGASDQREITTPVRLLVEETLKGTAKPGELVQFRQLGGQIGRTAVRYSDSVEFAEGEHVLLALYRSDGDTGAITHGELHPGQGKYVIESDGTVRYSSKPEVATLEQLRSRVLSAIGK